MCNDRSKDLTAKPSITTADELRSHIAAGYESLSVQLKKIARYVEEHGDHIGLDGVQEMASQCGVQPSAVIRFAKHFGFSGFSEMQALFRQGISRQIAPTRNYQARIREAIESGSRRLTSAEIAHEFMAGSLGAMQELQQQLDEQAFEAAVKQLADTDCIWIAAARRSFPVAAYLDYALQHTEKRVHMVSGVGSMYMGQVRSVRAGDVMIAISFAPYAEETLACVEMAKERGARVLAIADSRMCQLARKADVALLVKDNATFGFRALTSTMGLAQSLFIALAYQLELPYQPTTPGLVNVSSL
jgi:DNA-binding MurR/RpiR family transcriptional regulator